MASAPINWGIMDPGDPVNPDPDELLATVRDSGYVGCELGPLGYFGSSGAEIADRFATNGLAPVAIWMEMPLDRSLDDEIADQVGSVCLLLAEIGATHLIVSDLITHDRLKVVGRVEQFPETWWNDDQWPQVRQTLAAIAEIAAERNLTTAVHPHVGGHIESGREVHRLLEIMDGTTLTLCIDTGHIRIGGIDAIHVLDS